VSFLSIGYNLIIDAIQNIEPMKTQTNTTNGEKLEKWLLADRRFLLNNNNFKI
jgi:hypothetical protein